MTTLKGQFEVEAMEPRVLLSGDTLAAPTPPGAGTQDGLPMCVESSGMNPGSQEDGLSGQPGAQTSDLFAGLSSGEFMELAPLGDSPLAEPKEPVTPLASVASATATEPTPAAAGQPAETLAAPEEPVTQPTPTPVQRESDASRPVGDPTGTQSLAEQMVDSLHAPNGPPAEELALLQRVRNELQSSVSPSSIELDGNLRLTIAASGSIHIWDFNPASLSQLGVRGLIIQGADEKIGRAHV